MRVSSMGRGFLVRMNWPTFCFVVLMLSAHRGSAQACTQAWTGGLVPLNGVFGEIDDFQVFDDGNGRAVYAGGTFTHVGGLWTFNVARWTGYSWASLATGLPGSVRDLAVYDSGSGSKLYAGTSSGVYRWSGTTWSLVGNSTGANVRALEVFDDGSGPVLVAGGGFTTIGGVPASRVAAWNGTAWNPFGTGTDGTVWALKSWDDGGGPALYAGGDFVTAGGVSANQVAKWAAGAWLPLGPGFTGPGGTSVVAFEVFNDGTGWRLFAGGDFTHSGGLACAGVARWSGGSWTPLGTGLTGSISNIPVGAYALRAYDADGPGGAPPRLLVGGPFLQAGSASSRMLVAWDGSSWSPTSATGFESGVWIKAIQDVQVGGANLVLAGGDFRSVAGVSAGSVAQWANGTWTALGSGFCRLADLPALLPPPGINALAVYDDGSGPALYAGGHLGVGGSPIGNYVIKWNGLSSSTFGGGFNDEIEAIAVLDDGSGPRLYVGGNFTMVGGSPTSRVVFWSGALWSSMGAGPGGTVHDLTVFDDGTGPAIYAGGDSGVSRWNGSSWVPLPNSPPNVLALKVHDVDGAGPLAPLLFVGGSFATAGTLTVNGIAQWDGASWAALGTGVFGFNASVQQLVVFDTGTGPSLHAGGWFDVAGGVSAKGVARWSGSAWSPVGGGVNPGRVDALAVCDDGGGPELYAGGAFTSPFPYLVKWTGTTWGPLAGGLSSRPRAMTAFDDGLGPAILVGGWFYNAGGLPSPYLARWGCPRLGVSVIQSGGPGWPVMVSNSNMLVGHEYYNIFSADICGFGPGTGPYFGLCAADTSILFWQFALPLGTSPIHFVATSPTMFHGAIFSVPPMTIDVLSFDWTGGVLHQTSPVTRFTIQ
jgi:trimeric autotransporter adhesin